MVWPRLALFLLSLYLLFNPCYNKETTITGAANPAYSKGLYDVLTTMYKLTAAGVTFDLSTFREDQFDSTNALYNGTDNNMFYVLTSDLPALEEDENYPVLQFPDYATPIVILYNLGNFAKNAPLVLSRETLCGIFNQTITKWNDSSIQNDNQGIQFPAEDINVVYYDQLDGGRPFENVAFTSALNKMNGVFKVTEKFSVVGGTRASSYADLQRKINTANNTIGFTAQSRLDSSLDQVKVASLLNKQNNITNPKTDSVRAALSAGTFSSTMKFDASDTDNPEAYPIIYTSYVVLSKEKQSKCVEFRYALEFLLWSISEIGNIEAYLIPRGFTSLNKQDYIVEQLRKITCDGGNLLLYTFDTFSETMFVLNGLAILVLIFLYSYIVWHRKRPVIEQTSLVFLSTLYLGIVIGFLGSVVSAFPSTQPLCTATTFLSGISFMLIYGSLLVRVHAVKYNSLHATHAEGERFSATKHIAIVGGLVLWEIIFAIMWNTISPFNSFMLTCSSTSKVIWMGVTFAYRVVLLLVTFTSFGAARKLKYNFGEITTISFAVYNGLFVICFFIPAMILRDDVNYKYHPLQYVFNDTLYLFMMSLLPLIIMTFPKILVLYKKYDLSASN